MGLLDISCVMLYKPCIDCAVFMLWGVFLAIFNPHTPEILQSLPVKPIQLLWANHFPVYGYVHENECVGWDIYFLLNSELTYSISSNDIVASDLGVVGG